MGISLRLSLLVGIPLGVLLFVILVLYARWAHRRAPSFITVIKSGEPWIRWRLPSESWHWHRSRMDSREEPRSIRIMNRLLRRLTGRFLFIFLAVSCVLLLVEDGLRLQTELSLVRDLSWIAVFGLLALAFSALWIKAEDLLQGRAIPEVFIGSKGILMPGYHSVFGGASGEAGSYVVDARVVDIEGVNCLRMTVRDPGRASLSGTDVTLLEIPIPVGCGEEAQNAAMKLMLLRPTKPRAIGSSPADPVTRDR